MIIPKSCFKKKLALKKLYQVGENKIIKMLDILRIIKDNRKFEIILKNSLINDEIAKSIKHTENYLIDLDS